MKICWIIFLCGLAFNLTAGILSDPTKPDDKPEIGSVSAIVSRQLPVLTSIISGESRHVAVINGRRYSENDWVDGYQIKQITRRQVVLFKDEEMIELILPTAMEEMEVVQ